MMKRYLLLLPLLLAACAPDRADRLATDDVEKEALNFLNKHEYENAIWLIENRKGPLPDDQKLKFVLGQAYLGKAGIEPLAFAARVSGAQSGGNAEVQALFPDCSNEAIPSFKGTDIKCILKRVFQQAPDADRADLARARELFRRAYPDASQTPAWANTLIGVAETVSLVQRTGKIYLYAMKQKRGENRFDPAGYVWLAKQTKLVEKEATEALRRAQFSGDKISRLVSGVNGQMLFDRVKESVRFKAETRVNQLLSTLSDKAENEWDRQSRYQDMLDKLAAIPGNDG